MRLKAPARFCGRAFRPTKIHTGGEKLKNGGGVDAAKAAIHWAEGSQKHILTIADPQYPSLLLELSDAPLLLFAHGDTAFLNNNIISIVGKSQRFSRRRKKHRNFLRARFPKPAFAWQAEWLKA